MFDAPKLTRETERTLDRLLPRLQQEFTHIMSPADWGAFVQRLHTHFPTLFPLLLELYGDQ